MSNTTARGKGKDNLRDSIKENMSQGFVFQLNDFRYKGLRKNCQHTIAVEDS